MEIKNNIVNVSQLFLLCALRKTEVKAKNLERYSNFVLLSVGAESKELPREVKERGFVLHETDYGFDVCDRDEDIAWYHPPKDFLVPNAVWAYKGKLQLTEPLTKREKFILESYS